MIEIADMARLGYITPVFSPSYSAGSTESLRIQTDPVAQEYPAGRVFVGGVELAAPIVTQEC